MEQQNIPGIKDQPGPALGELISQISIDSANFQRLLKREKNVKTQEFNKAIEDAVIECFQSVPFLAIMEMDVESDLPDLRPDIQLTLKIKDKIKHIVKFRRKNETLTVGLYLELFWYCYYFIGLRNQISILSVW